MSSSVELKPYLGGNTQRISRLSDRFSYEVTCQPMHLVQAGKLVAALIQGLSEKVSCRVFQDGFPYDDYTDNQPLGAAAAAGANQLVLTNTGKPPLVGQFVSVRKSNVHYLHMITAVSGNTVTVAPNLKTSFSTTATAYLKTPRIEGFIDGNEQAWDIGMVSNLGVTFRVVEAQ